MFKHKKPICFYFNAFTFMFQCFLLSNLFFSENHRCQNYWHNELKTYQEIWPEICLPLLGR